MPDLVSFAVLYSSKYSGGFLVGQCSVCGWLWPSGGTALLTTPAVPLVMRCSSLAGEDGIVSSPVWSSEWSFLGLHWFPHILPSHAQLKTWGSPLTLRSLGILVFYGALVSWALISLPPAHSHLHVLKPGGPLGAPWFPVCVLWPRASESSHLTFFFASLVCIVLHICPFFLIVCSERIHLVSILHLDQKLESQDLNFTHFMCL